MSERNIDSKNSFQWALAPSLSVSAGEEAGIYHAEFLLLNINTGRFHGLNFTGAGGTAGAPIGASSSSVDPSSWTHFRTPRRVNFNDFDGTFGHITGWGIQVGVGYGAILITIFDTQERGKTLVHHLRISGWGGGLSFGGGMYAGIFTVAYVGEVERSLMKKLHPNYDPRPPLQLDPEDFEPPDVPVQRIVKYRLTPTERPLLIGADSLFDFDSDKLKPAAEEELRRISVHLNLRQDAFVSVAGYTDSTGSFAYNLGLSNRRAEAVKSWLVTHLVVPSDHIKASGYGEASPVAPNDTPDGRSRNRRVEIRVDSRM